VAYFERLLTIGPLASEGQGDFTLWNNEELTVNTVHSLGTLFDQSKASIISGGFVSTLNMYNTSTADLSDGSIFQLYSYNSSTSSISGGSIGNSVYSYDTSIVSMSDGSINWSIYSYDTSIVNISGGSIHSSLQTSGASIAKISGGSIGILHAYDDSTVNISGGQLAQTTGSILQASDTSTVKISGGSIGWLKASDTSNVTFIGQDFHLGDGLSLDGARVLGTGFLSGEWYDDTHWTVNITENAADATILVIPKSATPGDTNNDHIVDVTDYNNLVAQFGGPPGADSADFNYDNFVDLDDFAIQRGNFGFGVVTAPEPEFGATIPEPATLSMLALGGLALLRRRRSC